MPLPNIPPPDPVSVLDLALLLPLAIFYTIVRINVSLWPFGRRLTFIVGGTIR
jgi:hypothetical protein